MNRMQFSLGALLLGLLFAFAIDATAQSQGTEDYVIEQARGIDQRVDYQSLTKFGPWDDRNYDLTLEDVALLPSNDQFLYRVPAFFKILKRKEFVAEGTPLDDTYPREIHFEFYYRFGGLMQNGIVEPTSLGKYYYPDPMNPKFPPGTRDATLPYSAPIEGEGPLAIGNNETSVEVNPVNPMLLIAGSNGGGGQNQNYSTDGGVTWITGGVLPQTCCDPAMEWSVDGTVGYSATLGFVAGNALRATVFRSTNGGMTWIDRRDVSSGSSDKEYIHVDHSPTSPFQDNVYLTWHQGNVMFFSRSEDRALTWSTPVSFPQHPRGIGSDITTDPDGNIYYFYPTLNRAGGQAVLMLKSSDAGVTWDAPVVVATLSGRFDFAVPSMESRRVFIYVAADVDRNTGRIWATWTDNTPDSVGPNGSPGQNVAWIRVASSIDDGANWQLAATPHDAPLPPSPTAIDRYHPWLSVDDSGTVHLAFYDTRHSNNRTGVDFYYVASTDGGATWVEETRVSAETSVNITNGQEWGDYNGLAVNRGLNNVAMTWTDNRVVGASPVQRSFAARVTNIFGEPSFLLGIDGPMNVAACAGDPLPPITVTVASVSDYDEPVDLSTPNLDLLVFGAGGFTVDPVIPAQPAATSVLNLDTMGSAPSGTYPLTIRGEAGVVPDQIVKEVELSVEIFEDAPLAPVLVAPGDGAVGVSTQPVLSWDALDGAQEYLVELASDPGFTNIVFSEITGDTSVAVDTTLATTTTYYWRVSGSNTCGSGPAATAFSFTTSDVVCRSPALAIPDGSPAGTEDTLRSLGFGTLESLRVSLDIDHTWVGDVTVTLRKLDSNVVVPLVQRPGFTGSGFGCNGNDIQVVLDDTAALSIQNDCTSGSDPTQAYIQDGEYQPAGNLGDFAGVELQGRWRLFLSDAVSQDAGTLNQWCLLPAIDPADAATVFRGNFE